MNTSHLVIGGYQATQRQQDLVPWIVGGIVVVIALFILSRINK